MNLLEVFARQVQERPHAIAIIQTRAGLDSGITFSQLDMRARKIAALLRQEGIQAGDPVLIFHPVSIDLYTVLLGVFTIGAVAMFLDPSVGREHVDRCCELQPPRALIASPKAHLLRLVSAAVRRIRLKFVCGPWLPGAVPISHVNELNPLRRCEPCAPETPALLTFTSGSTGLPKAAVRSHGFLLAQHRVLEHHIQLVPDEVDLTTLPVFLLANLASGLTSVIPDADLRAPGSIEPGPVLEQIRRHRVTRTAASPAFFERLLVNQRNELDALRGLRKIYTGGAPVFPRLLERLSNAAPHAQVEAVYGSTEAEPIAHLNTRDLKPEDREALRRGNGLLTGKVIPEINLRILKDQWGVPLGTLTPLEFRGLQLPTEQVGEIVVSGDHVLKGYLHGRGEEETKFSINGEVWHRTGDAGKLDGQGRLWLMGRCSAKVQDSRGQLYPFAVECVASEHADIRRAAFVSYEGRRVLAIELEEGAGATSLERLPKDVAWASVDQVLSLNRIPVDKRHNAKIDYPELRRLLAER